MKNNYIFYFYGSEEKNFEKQHQLTKDLSDDETFFTNLFVTKDLSIGDGHFYLKMTMLYLSKKKMMVVASNVKIK